ncbi:unnamed protein product [Durusdinium trenchii]|uniref:protein disulfide-isomerase n=1 Tax=Durusdinium trenchii TaxID=1381693 RepID=A0ABP0PJT4_9DINO
MGQAVRCLWLAAVFLANSEEVVELDGQNFTWAMRAYPRLLLFFYAPWCGHSRSLDPEVRRAAAELQGSVAVAKIDASMEVEIADEFGISAYPGLFLLQKGSYEEFTGRRSAAAIADWTRSKIGSALELVNNSDQLQDALGRRGVHSALVATGDAGRQATVKRLAERFRTWGKFIFLAGGLHPRVQLFRGLDELLEGPASASASDEEAEQKLVEFMQAHQLPLFGEVSEENFYHYVVFADAAAHKDYLLMLGAREFPVFLLQKGTLSAIEVGEIETWALPLESPIRPEAIISWMDQVLPRLGVAA